MSGPQSLLEEAEQSLPGGAAQPEALAVRLRRAGVDLTWGAPEVLRDTAAAIRLCHARGASSVELARADPSLLTEMQLGAFFHAYWRRRVVRRAACRLGIPRRGTWTSVMLMGVAADAAFWLGVRSVATTREWERLTRSSYVVLYYHRIAGEQRPGEERLDVHPKRFEGQQRLLRVLGFRPLAPNDLLDFHRDPSATLPRRSYLLAADDGFRDAVHALRRHASSKPQVFISTSHVGGNAWWADNEPVATWAELDELHAAGAAIGSHGRGHTPFPDLDADALQDELVGSLRDLETHLPCPSRLLAYPHGRHDERVRAAAVAAGYEAAFTTQPGRNGAGTDAYCLRRVGLKDWDGPAAVCWKAATGELVPWWLERWKLRFRTATARRRAARRQRRNAPN